jgi:hypothetical protein
MQKIFSTKEKTEKIAENGGNLYNEAEQPSGEGLCGRDIPVLRRCEGEE